MVHPYSQSTDRWASFDCYGTLIDWRGGQRSALSSVWPDADPSALVARYHELEPQIQAGRGISYRQVMAEALAGIAAAEGLALPPGKEDALAESLPAWPPFPDVAVALDELRSRGWRLAVLSNTDADLLEASLERIGVPVDHSVVASEIGSYKPAPGHWETFLRETGANRRRHVHVAASVFHDVEPCARLGLSCVWINRLGERSWVPRTATLPDLTQLPDTLEGLVPPLAS
jgi:2-haloacid dehalogenase